MTKEEVVTQAKEIATLRYPTRKGLFDARGRLNEFAVQCLKNGVIPFLGVSFLFSDEQTDEMIREYNLDWR